MSNDPQASLFPTMPRPALTANSPLQAALGLFEKHMKDEGFAVNTVKAFISDIRLLGKYLGVGQPIGEIGTQNLNDFLNWLLYERGVPCSPKSYSRRVTTLKVFFGWLHKSGVLITDPANAVIQRSVTSPLPTVATAAEIDRALAVTSAWREGDGLKRSDARPHMLLTLLLQTGIKKTETVDIVPNHIDRSDPGQPYLFVRKKKPSDRYKERKINLDPTWLDVLDEYLDQYDVKDTLFTCTARNLEYILSDVGEAAGLKQGLLSFENLRWAAALRDFESDKAPDELRQKLGLSKITWRETRKKLEKIVAKRDIGLSEQA